MGEKEDEAMDYYDVLGLCETGTQSTATQIRKAYRAKALTSHPDKRPDDPLAVLEFQKIQKAYEILSDEQARKAFDELLNLKKIRLEKESQQDAKRQKMVQDLRERERAFNMQQQQNAAEERATKRLQEEIARIRAMHARKSSGSPLFPSKNSASNDKSKHDTTCKPSVSSDQERMLKATWHSMGSSSGGYTAAQLRAIFEEFGTVEDIVIRMRAGNKKGSAIVIMGSKSEVIAATMNHCGDLSNPLLVVPLLKHGNSHVENSTSQGISEMGNDSAPVEGLDSIIGAGYRDYEDNILKKLQKKAQEARSNS